MKLGLFGGGFKPFTTGHFSKLADAIRDNDKVILFYGMQQAEPVRYGKRGKPLASQQKFRGIGNTDRTYDEKVAESIFQIYKGALERIPEIEVVPVMSQAVDELGSPSKIRSPVRAIFDVLENFVEDDEMYEKITIYGDGPALRPYMRAPALRNLVQLGKIQFGGAIPESPDDYLSPEKLETLMTRGNEEAREALRSYYPDLESSEDDTEEDAQKKIEDLKRMQSIRGTEVRGLASSIETSEQAKRYLPPFLNDSEKDAIIQILVGEKDEDPQLESVDEAYLRAFIKGVIRG